MLVYDAIYIGFDSPKTLVALIMVTFIITIFYYDCWTDFVRFEIFYGVLKSEVKVKSKLLGIKYRKIFMSLSCIMHA